MQDAAVQYVITDSGISPCACTKACGWDAEKGVFWMDIEDETWPAIPPEAPTPVLRPRFCRFTNSFHNI
jgi:hypothetical protein